MDGVDPDSGTAWEVGYAYGKEPVILVRTDFRRTGTGAPYNAIIAQSATIGLNLPFASTSHVAAELLDALRGLDEGSQ
jgi:nucleoside 2-deoxyribosyltransferase